MTLIYAKRDQIRTCWTRFRQCLWCLSMSTNHSLELKCTVIDSGTNSNGPSQGVTIVLLKLDDIVPLDTKY